MPSILSIHLPFTEPEIVFSIVLIIMLLSPIILSKVRIPGIVGLILAGVIVGPHGFHLLERGEAIELFGTIGIIYLMFLVGLEVDVVDLKRNKNQSMVLGGLSFILPVIGGGLAAYYLFDYSLTTSILLGGTFATHTLIAYPIISRLGIAKSKVSTITFGATIIVDTAVLLMLAFISGSASGQADAFFWLQLSTSIAVFSFLVLWGLPKLSRWFFKHVESEGSLQYTYVLAAVFVTSVLAEIAGIEPILGAFLAGIALNPYVPHASPLMNRLNFIGNTIFIPFFLIGVGMMVDIKALFTGSSVIIFTGVFLTIAIVGKYLPALIIQKIYGFSAIERNLMFGLSVSRAAATIAVVLVGYRLNLVDGDVLNGTVVIILLSCLLSSVVTQNAGKKLAAAEEEDDSSPTNRLALPERVLVPIANPATAESLVSLAILMNLAKSKEPIFPLLVVKDNEDVGTEIRQKNRLLQKAVEFAASTDTRIQLTTRVDYNVANGIARAAKELSINKIILGWNGTTSTSDFFFGTILSKLLAKWDNMTIVAKLLYACNTFDRLQVVVPPQAHLEDGFDNWLRTVRHFAKQIGAKICFHADKESTDATQLVLKSGKTNISASYQQFDDWNTFLLKSNDVKAHDLLVIISARPETLSYHSSMEALPKRLSRHFSNASFLILYPEQREAGKGEVHLL